MRKRSRRLKPGTLAAYYAKLPHDTPDVVLHNESPARRADAHYLHSVLNCPRYNWWGDEEQSVIKELESRGYDVTTLNFTIQMAEHGSAVADATGEP